MGPLGTQRWYSLFMKRHHGDFEEQSNPLGNCFDSSLQSLQQIWRAWQGCRVLFIEFSLPCDTLCYIVLWCDTTKTQCMQFYCFTEQGESSRFKITDSCDLVQECHICLWLRPRWIHTNQNISAVMKVKMEAVTPFCCNKVQYFHCLVSFTDTVLQNCETGWATTKKTLSKDLITLLRVNCICFVLCISETNGCHR